MKASIQAKIVLAATSIRAQLFFMGNVTVQSWNVKQWHCGLSKTSGYPFLEFNVLGEAFSGTVRILLTSATAYVHAHTIEFYKDNELVKKITDVLPEDLNYTIDNFIEYNNVTEMEALDNLCGISCLAYDEVE